MLSNERKKDLIKFLPLIFHDLIDVTDIAGSATKGPKSFTQEIINRCEYVTKNADEFQWLVEACSVMVRKSRGKDAVVLDRKKGEVLTFEQLYKEYGVIIHPDKRKII